MAAESTPADDKDRPVARIEELESALADAEERLHLAAGPARTIPWAIALTGGTPQVSAALGAWWSGVFPADRARFEAQFQEAVRGSGRLETEIQVMQGAHSLWILCQGAVVRDASGRPLRMVGLTQDVTAQRRAAEALRDSEERFRAIFHQGGAGVAQVGLDGRWITVNQRFCEILGRTREELHNRTSQELTHPDDVAACREHFRRLLDGEAAPHFFEKRYVRSDGGVVWVSMTVTLVRDAEGRCGYYVLVAEDISARKAAEERLRHTRERLLLAHQIAGLASWEWDPQSRRRDFPPEFFALFDIDPADPDPVHAWMTGVHPEDRPAIQSAMHTSIQGGYSTVEYRYLRPPFRTRWFHGITQRLPDGRLLAISLEVTRLKEQESAQRESEEQFRTLANSIPQLAWIADASGWIFWFNQRWYDYTGGTEEEMAGWGWKKVIAPEHAERVVAQWRHRLEAGESWEDTFPLRSKTGEDRWFLSRAVPIRDAEGSIVRWFGANTDITDRLSAERLLRESEARFRRLYDANVIGILTADLEKIYDANDVFLRMVGYTREEMERNGIRWREITPPEFQRLDERALEEILARGECTPFEKEYIRKDGARTPILIGAALLERSPLRWVCFALDLTERKNLERRILDAQKMESVGALAGGVAHDFNNLLVGVIGNASLAQSLTEPEGELHELLARIIHAGEEAAHLTRQMLAYSGKGRFLIQPVDLAQTLREAVALVRPSLPNKIALKTELPPALPNVEADPAQIQQVFTNLLLNAAEALDARAGTIWVRAGTQEVDEETIERELDGASVAPGQYVFLEVRDDGCGMDAATRARIFDPFFTTKFTGRGLGLAAVSGVVRGHHGAIQATSAPGEGSTFRVLLPAAGTREAAARRTEVWPDLKGQGTILVVDDEEVVRSMARRTLESHGYEVLLASSGPEAIEKLGEAPERVSLVILDLSMPGMSGHETLPELRKIRPGVPVLISSGYTESQTMPQFEGAAVAGFVQKPYGAHRLAAQVKAALGDLRPQEPPGGGR